MANRDVDGYTSRARKWLDARFRHDARGGRYNAHQPIYGFDEARTAGLLRDYVRLYRVLSALSELSFETLLDVGGAEGMLAVLARDLLGADVHVSDLSSEVCERASEIFGLEVTPADIHALPFADESFDVLVCAETLEHVFDPEIAVKELLRVARRAVVISVPHESPSLIERNRCLGEPHAHIHAFDRHSFDRWKPRGGAVHALGIMSPAFRIPLALLESRSLSSETAARVGRHATDLYARSRALLRKLPAWHLATLALSLDELACCAFKKHDGVLAVLLKDPRALCGARVQVRARDVLTFAVR